MTLAPSYTPRRPCTGAGYGLGVEAIQLIKRWGIDPNKRGIKPDESSAPADCRADEPRILLDTTSPLFLSFVESPAPNFGSLLPKHRAPVPERGTKLIPLTQPAVTPPPFPVSSSHHPLVIFIYALPRALFTDTTTAATLTTPHPLPRIR